MFFLPFLKMDDHEFKYYFKILPDEDKLKLSAMMVTNMEEGFIIDNILDATSMYYPYRHIFLQSGDLNDIEDDVSKISFIIIGINGVTNLKGVLKDFTGHVLFTHCDSLEMIRYGFNIPNAKGLYFLPCPDLKRIGSNFMYQSKVETVIFESNPSLETIDKNFLADCSDLKAVNFSDWRELLLVEYNFMMNCTSLVYASFANWVKLFKVGNNFLSNCTNLIDVNFKGWESLKTISDNFMNSSLSLQSVDLSDSRQIEYIGKEFLKGSKFLKSLNIIDRAEIRYVAEDSL